MEKFYFTFGQNHTHRYVQNGVGVTLDCDGVVEITAVDGNVAREIMFEAFGMKWSMQYPATKPNVLDYFPRGIVLRLPRAA